MRTPPSGVNRRENLSESAGSSDSASGTGSFVDDDEVVNSTASSTASDDAAGKVARAYKSESSEDSEDELGSDGESSSGAGAPRGAGSQIASMPPKSSQGRGIDYDSEEVRKGRIRNSRGRQQQKLWRTLVRPYIIKHRRSLSEPEEDTGVYEKAALETVDVLSDLGTTAASIMSIENAVHAGKEGINSESEADGHIMANDVLSNAIYASTGFVSSLAGIYNTGKGLRDVHRARKSKNKSKLLQSSLGAASSFAGLASAGLQTASAGVGLSGDSGTSGYLTIASFAADAIGSAIDTVSTIAKQRHHKHVTDRINIYGGTSAGRTNPADLTSSDRQKKTVAKAKQYSMLQAHKYNSKMASEEKENVFKNIAFGVVPSMLGLANGIVSSTASYQGGMMASGILGLAQMALKNVGKGLRVKNHFSEDKKREENKDKKTEVDLYLSTKIEGVKADARSSGVVDANGRIQLDADQDDDADDGGNNGQFTDELAKRVALARLGLDVELEENSALPDEIYQKAYNIVTLKRANHIHESGNDRTAMLTALGLPTNASVEEIAEALGYEG